MHDCTNVYVSEAHSCLNYKMVNNGGNWQLPLIVGGMVSCRKLSSGWLPVKWFIEWLHYNVKAKYWF